MNNKPKYSIIFTRILTIALIGFVGIIIYFSYFVKEPRYNLSPGIIILIALLLVLALSELFDSFSIVNLITLQKEKASREKELVQSKEENSLLRKDLNSFIASFTTLSLSMSNNSTTIFNLDTNKVYVEHAKSENGDEEFDDTVQNNTSDNNHYPEGKRGDEHKNENNIDLVSNDNPRNKHGRKKISFFKLEEYIINRFCRNYQIPTSSLETRIQFSSEFIDIDPIMNRNIIFDAYYRTIQCEYFIDIKTGFSSSNINSVYLLLSRIYHYRIAKKKQAKLLLIIPTFSEKYHQQILGHSSPYSSTKRFKEIFDPAIKNELLEILEIAIPDEDCESMFI